jgi:hypothetical protein
MTKRTRSVEARRAARDKSILDHLTKGPLKPQRHPDPDLHPHSPEEGRTLDRAIHEVWNSAKKGGLPDF